MHAEVVSEPQDRWAWWPQPGPQFHAYTAKWCREMLYGGAKFGGKSDFLIGDYLQDVHEYGQHWQGIIIRQSLPELEDVIGRAQQIYPATGAAWKEGKKQFVWERGPGKGACLKFRYLETLLDFDHYNGHSYPFIGFDELGQWADPGGYHKMKGCLRWGGCVIPFMRIRATANPGGQGHQWVRKYFKLDTHPLGYHLFEEIDEDGSKWTTMFIPSRVQDNEIGLQRNPGYLANLRRIGSPEMVRAWLEGDWDIVAGAFFPEWSGQTHVVDPFIVPAHWTRGRGMDWGSARPFSVGWWAVSSGEWDDHRPHHIPRGALVQYREWYGEDPKKHNVGLRMRAEDVAAGIVARSAGETYSFNIADPAIFKEDGGPSIAETMALHGVRWRRGDNSRVTGAQQFRARLIGDERGPMLYSFATCPSFNEQIPALQTDTHKPEDCDTDSPDHAYDQGRYICMSRPLTPDNPVPKTFVDPVKQPIGQMMQAHFKAAAKRRR